MKNKMAKTVKMIKIGLVDEGIRLRITRKETVVDVGVNLVHLSTLSSDDDCRRVGLQQIFNGQLTTLHNEEYKQIHLA